MTESITFEPRELLARLVDGGVEFVIIGGLAAQAHGSPSITADVDIVPSWDRANLRKLEAVLHDITAIRHGVPSGGAALPPLDARTLLAGAVFTLNSRFGRIDLLANPDPGLDYAELRRSAVLVSSLGMRLLFASLDDLIAMKRAAGRPKDRVELEILGALREEIDRRGD
jgi:predicted nucleotidyltransferase